MELFVNRIAEGGGVLSRAKNGLSLFFEGYRFSVAF